MRWLPWAVAIVAAVTAFGVFTLPWLVPSTVRVISSDSQALGFDNRVALVALALGCAALFGIGIVWRFGSSAQRRGELTPVVADARPERGDAIDRRLLAGLMLASVAMVALMAYIYRSHPFADSAYFVDRMLRAAAGGRFYRDFEFAYGPLLFYPEYGLWQLLKPTGLSVYNALYATTAALYVGGLAMAAYLLNRLDIPRRYRHAALLVVFAFGLFTITLGPNYLALRFLTPFVALVWTAEMTARDSRAGTIAALVSAGLAFAVSPEMGIAATIGIVVALGAQAGRHSWRVVVPAAVGLITGAVCFWLYYASPGSTLAQFGAGAWNFPVLPGQPALVFVLTMLALSLGVGMTTGFDASPSNAVQLAWYVSAGVLMAAAIGRADFGHIFWNGLGAFLLAVAVVHRVWPRLAAAYLGVVGVVFVVTSFTVATTSTPAVFASAVNSGVISRRQSMHLAQRLGRTQETGRRWYTDSLEAEPTPSDVATLLASKKVFAPFLLHGKVGVTLAEGHALLSLYAIPGQAMSPVPLERILAALDSAHSVILPSVDYDGYLRAAETRTDTESVTTMRLSKTGTDPGFYSLYEAFPLSTHPVNPTFDPNAILGSGIRRDWVLDHESGSYSILRRRSKAG